MIEEEYEDIFTGLKDEITKSLFIRYYAMQEYFQMTPQEFSLPQSQANKYSITLVYNKIIHETIYELYIMNKLIYTKAKIATTLLDNGRDISKKKNAYWAEFLETQSFVKLEINKAFNLLQDVKKNVLKYSVLSLSNLLLKLGINMSKISVIPIQKFLTFQCLNIPILAIIFLQFLQFKLFNSKKHQEQIHKSMFLRQLPKITVIKLSKYKNNTQIQMLETAQEIFFTRQSQRLAIKNIQYIQLYEEEDPFYKNFTRKTNYDNIMSFCLTQKFQIKAPFTFEILLLMRSLLFPLVRDFKPDLIVYYESSYDCDKKIMDEQVRGLMLCQMSEETACSKMYVIKQIGDSKYNYPTLTKELGSKEQVSSQKMDIINEIDKQRAKQLERQGLAKKEIKQYIRKVKKVLLNDLCFISLALIQKTTFDSIEEASHQHFYNKEYLQGLIIEQERVLKEYEKKDENFNRIMNNKINGIKSMKQVLTYHLLKNSQESRCPFINLINRQNYFDDFYNFIDGQKQKLQAQVDGKLQIFSYNEQDQFYVKYSKHCERYILIFIIKSQQMIVLSKFKNIQKLNHEITVKLDKKNLNLEGSTLIASDKYLYRGFGRYRNSQNYNQSIFKFQISPIGKSWEVLDDKSIPIKSDGREDSEIFLQKKIYGYGIFDEANKNVIMTGGYIESENEQKISKTIYIIKNDSEESVNTNNQIIISGLSSSSKSKIYSMGKTNKILFSGVNLPLNEMFLHPFIFGIPFTTEKPSSNFILNSNGSYINVNNSKKIFVTNFKLSSVIIYNGIISQKRLNIKTGEKAQQVSTILVQAQLIVKSMILSNYQHNIFENSCCLQTLDEGKVFLQGKAKDQLVIVSRGEQMIEKPDIDNEQVVMQFI